MDIIWTGEFANAGWIAPVPEDIADEVTQDVFPSVVETAEFEDKLYAVPLWSNTQLLWYRTDQVRRPPKTWDEMIDQGVELGPDQGLIEVQANRYEGLVVWFNPMLESAGGHFLAGPEEIDLEQEPTERALEVMGKLSTSDAGRPGDQHLRGGPGAARRSRPAARTSRSTTPSSIRARRRTRRTSSR